MFTLELPNLKLVNQFCKIQNLQDTCFQSSLLMRYYKRHSSHYRTGPSRELSSFILANYLVDVDATKWIVIDSTYMNRQSQTWLTQVAFQTVCY